MEMTRTEAIAMLKDKEAIDHHISVQKRALEIEERSIKTQLWAKERQDIIAMRAGWSQWILRSILLVIISDVVLIFLLGFHIVSFNSYWVVPAFIADGITKTIGLAYIVVNFLFHRDSIDNTK